MFLIKINHSEIFIKGPADKGNTNILKILNDLIIVDNIVHLHYYIDQCLYIIFEKVPAGNNDRLIDDIDYQYGTKAGLNCDTENLG